MCITLNLLLIAGIYLVYLACKLVKEMLNFRLFGPTYFNFIIREECACHPVRYFAIFSTQRSGSGWFETLLNSHMNISSNGEIFSVKVRRANISSITETLDKLYNLDWMSSAAKNECTSAVGLKWMLNQVSVMLCLSFFIFRFKDVHKFVCELLSLILITSQCYCP